jgi:hypothetical protein
MRNQSRVSSVRPYDNIVIAGDHAYYSMHDGTGTGTTLAARSGSVLGDQDFTGTTANLWDTPGFVTFNAAGMQCRDTSAAALALGDLSSASHGLLIACTLKMSAYPDATKTEFLLGYGDVSANQNGWYIDINALGKPRLQTITAAGTTGAPLNDTFSTGADQTFLCYFDRTNNLLTRAINLEDPEGEAGPGTSASDWPSADTTGRGLTFFARQTVVGTYQQNLALHNSGMQVQNLLILSPQSDISADIATMAIELNRHPYELARVFHGV